MKWADSLTFMEGSTQKLFSLVKTVDEKITSKKEEGLYGLVKGGLSR